MIFLALVLLALASLPTPEAFGWAACAQLREWPRG
jgi:hypothetical protein